MRMCIHENQEKGTYTIPKKNELIRDVCKVNYGVNKAEGKYLF